MRITPMEKELKTLRSTKRIEGFEHNRPVANQTVNKLAKDIIETGSVVMPIICSYDNNTRKYKLIDGHHRVEAINLLESKGYEVAFEAIVLKGEQKVMELFLKLNTTQKKATGMEVFDVIASEGKNKSARIAKKQYEVKKTFLKDTPTILGKNLFLAIASGSGLSASSFLKDKKTCYSNLEDANKFAEVIKFVSELVEKNEGSKVKISYHLQRPIAKLLKETNISYKDFVKRVEFEYDLLDIKANEMATTENLREMFSDFYNDKECFMNL